MPAGFAVAVAGFAVSAGFAVAVAGFAVSAGFAAAYRTAVMAKSRRMQICFMVVSHKQGLRAACGAGKKHVSKYRFKTRECKRQSGNTGEKGAKKEQKRLKRMADRANVLW